MRHTADADIAQQVERILGKDEVPGSNPGISSQTQSEMTGFLLFIGCFLQEMGREAAF